MPMSTRLTYSTKRRRIPSSSSSSSSSRSCCYPCLTLAIGCWVALFALIVLAETFVSFYVIEDPSRTLEETDDTAKQPASGSYSKKSKSSLSSLDILMDAVRDVHRPVLDAELDMKKEAARCERYDMKLRDECLEGNSKGQQRSSCQRRRIFAGSLLADDSWHALGANALEAYGVYEAVVFVESNRTQSFHKRDWRFFDDAQQSSENNRDILLSGIYGPETKVYIDPFVDEENQPNPLVREQMQRELILKKWKALGMGPNDIGLIMDVDETATHDFLRAVQICHVPIWDNNPAAQNCRNPLLRSSAIFFEGAPSCIHRGPQLEFRRFMNPSMVIGACIEGIGDAARYPSAPRTFVDKNGLHHGKRQDGYGVERKNQYHQIPEGNAHGNYPLFNAADFRQFIGNTFWGNRAFHFHNFFVSLDKLRFKHLTYGHTHAKAFEVPLGAVNADLNVLVKCGMDRDDTGNRWRHLENGLAKMLNYSYDWPVAFQLKGYKERRLEEVRELIARDEEEYGRADKFDGHHLYNEETMLTHKGRRHQQQRD